MKKDSIFFVIFLMVTVLLTGCKRHQQEPPQQKFSPKEFQADLEKFVVDQCHFTDAEAKTFLPLFREMRQKKFQCFQAEHKMMETRPETDEQLTKVLCTLDSLGVERARIEQQYHKLMLKSIPAGKIMESVRAEDEFHQMLFRKFQGGKPGDEKPHADKPHADKPHADKPHADKPQTGKPQMGKPHEGPQGGPHGGPHEGPHGGPQGGPHGEHPLPPPPPQN